MGSINDAISKQVPSKSVWKVEEIEVQKELKKEEIKTQKELKIKEIFIAEEDLFVIKAVKITLIPQLDQGNEEVIRVTLLTFDLKR
jgi:hypothetical protein